MKKHRHAAFTLVEVLVVIAIIGLLVALILPAVQAAREAARRAQCSNRLAQLIIAAHNYESSHRVFPMGVVNDSGPIISAPVGYHHNWIVQLLPYLGEQNAFRSIDFSVGVYAPPNAAVRDHLVQAVVCPANGWNGVVVTSSYAAVYHDSEAPIDAGNNGVFFLNSSISSDEIPDGLAYTLFFGDRIVRGDIEDLGWMSGTRATLRNTGIPLNTTDMRPIPPPPSLQDQLRGALQDGESASGDATGGQGGRAKLPAKNTPKWVVGGFSSEHPVVVQFAVGDGSVRPIAESCDGRTLQLLGNRADGQMVELDF